MAATIFAANSSGILVNNTAVDGVRGVDYQVEREQGDVYALGGAERVAIYYGASRVQGRLRVASASPALDTLTTSGDKFQVVANLKQGQATRSVAFDDCYMLSKEFVMEAGKHGETVYSFTAVRVREQDSAATPAPAA
jgi:hypothetical protein